MLILAIDTALDACAAGVLDTDAGKMIAQESLPMKRGHAEALMPLIARVMKESGIGFAGSTASRSPPAPAALPACGSALSAARGIALAAGKPVVGVTTLTAYAAPIVNEGGEHPVISAIDARHDHVYLQVVAGNGSLAGLAARGADRRSAGRRALRRAVSGRQCRENSRRALAGRCAAAVPGRCAGRARHRLGRLARRRGQSRHRAGRPYYLRAPDAKPQKDRCRQAAQPAHIMIAWLSDLVGRRRRRDRTRDPARCARLAQLAWRIVSPRLGRRRIRADAERAQHAGAPPAAGAQGHRLCGVADGGGRGRNIVDRDRCQHRGRGLSRNLLLTHLGHLAGRGVRTVFLEVEENNQPARRLYEWAGFASLDAANAIIKQPGGEQLNAVLMRRDLS
jgi:tRNA threonylcarbamoyladenosine biosynthesis protein TsaB